MKTTAALGLILVSLVSHAETPQQILKMYAPTGNAVRGEAVFRQKNTVNEKMPSCTSCHTENPINPGHHAITGKIIQPMAVAVNPERFTDSAKVEKWFGRNCKEVLGRACTPNEKADLIAYLSEVR
ncbi:MAG: DUF1924 domain-containing protein [Betaproteobacteria bacterium]|nr:DUF1924 domain-containing protein [Betaproteobacteria bacterium]